MEFNVTCRTHECLILLDDPQIPWAPKIGNYALTFSNWKCQGIDDDIDCVALVTLTTLQFKVEFEMDLN